MDPITLLLCLFLVPISSSALFTPSDNLLLNCGSQTRSTIDNRVFQPDNDDLPSSTRFLNNPNPLTPSEIYSSARVFTSPSSYSLHVTSSGPHVLRLHFHVSSPSLSTARFHVIISDFLLLSDFIPSTGPTTVKEFILPPFSSDDVILHFLPSSPDDVAFVSAIELFSAPRDLVPSSALLVGPTPNLNFPHDVGSNNALQTVFRVNIGGPTVTPFNDTLWRTWLPDTEHVISSDNKVVTTSGRIAYRKGGASREVGPDNVYSSARVSRTSNMTWVFPVDPGYNYLVRMHFCDIASLALNELYMNIYINGYLVYQDLDISEATGQMLASPYYIDFVADVESSGLLNIEVGPSKMNDATKVGGLLNGLEIMKMNNTVGSLSGRIPPLLVLKRGESSSSRGGTMARSFVCALVFVALLAMAFVLVMKWKVETGRGSGFAWTPLPLDHVSDDVFGKGSIAMPGKAMYV